VDKACKSNACLTAFDTHEFKSKKFMKFIKYFLSDFLTLKTFNWRGE